MKTKIFSIKQVKKAAKLIKKGELVAFPTETVYGLGANAFEPNAVKKIFTVKGRPSDNPLIIHIAKKEQLKQIAKIKPSQNQLVEKVIKKFWPGPLTIILKKTDKVPFEATGGLDTIAVRMPGHKTALQMIKFAGVPIAAPSANISGRPSATCFKHVLDDFKGKISGIIKSKDCKIGLESTVVDLTAKNPLLLRPGRISFEELRKILPNLRLYKKKNLKKARSPGMKYRHYAPYAKVILFEKSAINKIKEYEKKYKRENKKVKVVFTKKTNNFVKNLFKIFRECDKKNVDYILITDIEEKGIGLALMNRIRKAAFKIIK